MKIYLLIIAALIFIFPAFGQKQVDYSGVWAFDKVVSSPNDKLRTEAIEMLITQTPTEVQVGRATDSIINYPLGNETTIEVNGASGKTPLKLQAELTNKGKLILNLQQTINMSGDSAVVKIKETFELLADGSTLRATREVQNSKGLAIIEIFIARKLLQSISSNQTDKVHDVLDLKNQFSQGVLNGKAKHLEIPAYPPGASANRASGAVPIRVIFDEQGKVVFAQAIYGHPQLKSAALESAMKCTFEPVELNGQPIKVSGIIVFNFSPH